MIKVFANFLLAITSMSVPVAAGSFMHVYTEDKKPTSFEELKFQTITEIPDEEEVDEKKDEEEEDDTDSAQTANNSASSSVGQPSSAGSSGAVSGQPTQKTANGGGNQNTQKNPQSTPLTVSPPVNVPAPQKPVAVPSPKPQPQPQPQPVQVPQPASPPGPPPGGSPQQPNTNNGAGPSNNSKDGIKMTIETLQHFMEQEIKKNSGSDKFEKNWKQIFEVLSKLPDTDQKTLLDSFQLS